VDVMRHILLAMLLAALPAAANELVRLKVRGDVTQPYYLVAAAIRNWAAGKPYPETIE
jgi:hypothetical protein